MELAIRGEQNYRALARDMRQAAAELPAELNAGLLAEGKLIEHAVRRRALAIPTHGRKHTGLRERIAGSVHTTDAAGPSTVHVRVLADPARMPSGERALPALMEGLQRWQHPVYGRRSVWVTQASHPFAGSVLQAHVNAVQHAGTAASGKAAERIERGG